MECRTVHASSHSSNHLAQIRTIQDSRQISFILLSLALPRVLPWPSSFAFWACAQLSLLRLSQSGHTGYVVMLLCGLRHCIQSQKPVLIFFTLQPFNVFATTASCPAYFRIILRAFSRCNLLSLCPVINRFSRGCG